MMLFCTAIKTYVMFFGENFLYYFTKIHTLDYEKKYKKLMTKGGTNAINANIKLLHRLN